MTTGDNAERPTPQTPSQLMRNYLVVVPGVAAAGLAVLYAIGALIKAGQLSGADLTVRDTLPLVPLEQLLALGISSIVTSLILLVGWAGVAAFYIWATGKEARKKKVLVPPDVYERLNRPLLSGWQLTAWRAFGWVWTIAAILAYFWFFPFYLAVVMGAGMISAEIATRYRFRSRRWVFSMLVLYFGVIIAARVGQAFVAPTPLPVATLELHDGSTVRGGLIVHDGGWVFRIAPDTFRSFPERSVRVATVKSRERKGSDTPLLQQMWSRLFG